MSDTLDSIGSDMPSLSPADEAAFAAEEAASKEQRASMPPGQSVRYAPEEDPEPAPAPAAAVPAPAAPAPATPAAAPVAANPAGPAPSNVEADDDDPTAVAATDGKRYVPLETMISARRSMKGEIGDLKAALAEQKANFDRLLGAVGKPAAPAAAPAPAPEPVAAPVNPYDKNTHPLEHLEWKNEQTEKRLEAYEKAQETAQTQARQTAALTGAKQQYSQINNAFAADPKNAGYAEAYQFLGMKEIAKFEAMGFSNQEAREKVEQMEWDVVQRAVTAATPQHPSVIIWNMAKAAGWTPAVPAPAPAAAPAMTPAKQIELQAAGAAAALSLSDAPGGAAEQPMTASRLASMSKEELDAFTNTPKGQALWNKMAMGPGKTGAAA